uniref:Uncharacterized protein n=1 Tax=Arundo donax TaxID=35708 RepID=A0A0A8YSR1_ARUDO
MGQSLVLLPVWKELSPTQLVRSVGVHPNY